MAELMCSEIVDIVESWVGGPFSEDYFEYVERYVDRDDTVVEMLNDACISGLLWAAEKLNIADGVYVEHAIEYESAYAAYISDHDDLPEITNRWTAAYLWFNSKDGVNARAELCDRMYAAFLTLVEGEK